MQLRSFTRHRPPPRSAYRLLAVVTVVLLLLAVVSCRQKGRFPESTALRAELLQEPVQRPTERDRFDILYRGNSIEVEPVAEYELWGLVVSHNNIESIADIYHDSSSIDTKDLCVLWGDNLRNDDFRRVEFKSGPWTCYYRFPPGVSFDATAISNNHLITDRTELRDALDDVRIGDQIRLRGVLANYRMEDWGDFWRRSSLVREDTGNGACEVLFFEELEVLSAGTPGWYGLWRLSTWLLALVPVAWVYVVWLDSRRFSRTLAERPGLQGPPPEIWPGEPEGPAPA